jgi:hypothetical protein
VTQKRARASAGSVLSPSPGLRKIGSLLYRWSHAGSLQRRGPRLHPRHARPSKGFSNGRGSRRAGAGCSVHPGGHVDATVVRRPPRALPAADEISDAGGQYRRQGRPARRPPPISSRSLRGVVRCVRILPGDPEDTRDPALSAPGDRSPTRGHKDDDRDVRKRKGASFSQKGSGKGRGTAGRRIRGSYSASDGVHLRSADKDTLARPLLLPLPRRQIQARCRGVSQSSHSLFGEPIPSLMSLFLLLLSPGAPVKVAARRRLRRRKSSGESENEWRVRPVHHSTCLCTPALWAAWTRMIARGRRPRAARGSDPSIVSGSLRKALASTPFSLA